MTDSEKANPPDSVVQELFLAGLTATITTGAADVYLISMINDILKTDLKDKVKELIEEAKLELGLA